MTMQVLEHYVVMREQRWFTGRWVIIGKEEYRLGKAIGKAIRCNGDQSLVANEGRVIWASDLAMVGSHVEPWKDGLFSVVPKQV